MIPDANWLALGTLTETDRPREFAPVMQVILNRVRSKAYPDSVYEVLRQPWQFSFFNPFKAFTDEPGLWKAVREAKKLSDEPGPLETLARLAAGAMLALPPECAILTPATVNYWSPRSMIPPGSLPRWNWNVLRCFEYPGIAASRFVFAETVRAGSLGSGNADQFRFWNAR